MRSPVFIGVALTIALTQAGSLAGQYQNAGLSATLERIRAQHDLPALAAAVVRGNDVQTAAVGVRRAGSRDRVHVTDRFHIASCTKGMTAMIAARLVEQKRLAWTSRLVDVLPELRMRFRNEYRDATLEQLLAHAAQMPAYTQFGPQRLEELKALKGTPTQQRMTFLVDVLGKEPPNRAKGDAGYSNVGYTAAALMMERVTGRSWEQLVEEFLFRPLQMTNVGFGWPATKQTPGQPLGHRRQGNLAIPQEIGDAYMLPVALWPAGAVNASVVDLARYAADHLRGLRGERSLLQNTSYTRMHRTLARESDGFTLGWGVRTDPRWGRMHYTAGSGGTFFVRIVIVPRANIAIVAAANSGDAGAATRDVVNAILNEVDS